MTVQIVKSESGRVLKIAGTLEIAAGQELRQALRDFVCREQGTAVDLSEADGCDAAGVQLLCSAGKTLARAGRQFQIVGLSPAIRDACSGLGFSLTGEDSAGQEPGSREEVISESYEAR